jgi:hypothetical protein
LEWAKGERSAEEGARRRIRGFAGASVIAEIVASGITTVNAIARALTRREVRTATGRATWGSAVVGKLLRRINETKSSPLPVSVAGPSAREAQSMQDGQGRVEWIAPHPYQKLGVLVSAFILSALSFVYQYIPHENFLFVLTSTHTTINYQPYIDETKLLVDMTLTIFNKGNRPILLIYADGGQGTGLL